MLLHVPTVTLASCSERLREQGALPWPGQHPERSEGRVCTGEAAHSWTSLTEPTEQLHSQGSIDKKQEHEK